MRDARAGSLERDWRSVRPAALWDRMQTPKPGLECEEPTAFDEKNPLAALASLDALYCGSAVVEDYFAMLEVVNSPHQLWEPAAAAGPRQALDAWYKLSIQCVDEFEAALPVSERVVDHPGAVLPAAVNTRREQCLRERDLLTEWYEAGLVSTGADVDWVERSRQRQSGWSDSQASTLRRDEQLRLLDDPSYRAAREVLPHYWL